MKKIIFTVVGLLVLASGAFWAYEAYEVRELENYVLELNKTANSNNAQNTMDSKSGTYSLAEISVHNNKSDCWMAIDGSVYDVTTFIDKHPGGSVILEGCGKDATDYFKGVKQHFKPLVQTILSKLKIGEIKN